MGDDNTTILASNEEYCEFPIDSDDQFLAIPTSIISVSPNPFNPTTRISYYLEKNGDVNISLFNIKGKLVKTLVNNFQPSGGHSIEWDGKDDAGKKCSSGIYFSILSSGKYSDISKLVLLK